MIYSLLDDRIYITALRLLTCLLFYSHLRGKTTVKILLAAGNEHDTVTRIIQRNAEVKTILQSLLVLCLTIILFSGCITNYYREGYRDEDNIDKSMLVTVDNDVLSPSKEFLLKLIPTKDGDVRVYYFEVVSAKENISVFRSEAIFRLRDKNFILWGEDDTIWGYSGDIGTFYWEKAGDFWEKKAYADNKGSACVPDILVKLRPSVFLREWSFAAR